MGGAYPSHWEPARTALSTCTVPMKAIAEEGFHNCACEYRVAENIMVAEQLAPAFCDVLIALLGMVPVAVKVVTRDVVMDVW